VRAGSRAAEAEAEAEAEDHCRDAVGINLSYVRVKYPLLLQRFASMRLIGDIMICIYITLLLLRVKGL